MKTSPRVRTRADPVDVRVGRAAGVGAAVLVRGATLAQLLAAALLLTRADYHLVAIALGVAAATQVVTDSGAAAYLSVIDTDPESLPSVVRHLVALQVAVGCLAAVVGGVLVVRVAGTEDIWLLLGLLAIPATSAVESMGRLCRVLWLRNDQLLEYAGLDGAYCAARLVAVACLAAGLGAPSFLVGCAGTLGITLLAWRRAMGTLAPRVEAVDDAPFTVTARRSLSYGVSVMAAGLYSQAPVVLTSALSSVETAAAVAVATRLVQPLEMVAGSYAQISLPRLTRSVLPRRRFLGTLGWQGLLLALAGLAGASLFLELSDADASAWTLTFILCAALPLKYLNYGLATVLMALLRPDLRTLVSLALGLLCATAIVLVADGSVTGIGVVVVLNEILLAAGLAVAVRAATGETRHG